MLLSVSTGVLCFLPTLEISFLTFFCRGFAFVSSVRHDDAARAIAKLSGHGYDHLILHLEWAKYVTRVEERGVTGKDHREVEGQHEEKLSPN
jgi:hypothetical protein